MNKKKIFTIIGVITALITTSGTAIACHFHSKKNTDQNIPEKSQQESQYSTENIKSEDDDKITNKSIAMYGVPPQLIEEKNKRNNEEDIYIEKYGIPKTAPLLKYAAPPFYNDKADEPVIMPMYALPDSENIKETEQTEPTEKNQNPWK